MTKRIKIKKRKFKYRILIYAFLAFCGYQISYNIILNIKLAATNEEFITALLANSNYHMLYDKKANNIFNKAFSYFFNVNEPVSILENTFHYKTSNEQLTTYVNNISQNKTENPQIFIYNTHQSENYAGENLKEYNINPGVMMAAYIFKDKLEKEGITTLVLQDNLIDYMNLNNMKYSQSYKASKTFIEPIINQNKDLKLIIDLHRDSIPKEKSTVNINGKSCAKIVIVIGNEYDNYEQNLDNAEKINNKIKEKYPTLTRNILIKGGKGNNGIYNQNLNPNMMLIELGTNTNTIDEVLNTIELLSPILKEYVNES